ncbi:MAG: calcium-binding protein, partial [Pseudomonadota bacterium]|nr:calcium-binding protein [Pseudomonadota bacterium]
AEYRALLQFGAGISPDDIIVIRDSDDLILEINEEDKVTINNWYQGTQGYHRIGTIQFGSDDPVGASTWINSKPIHFQESGTLEGTIEANILLGTAGVDYIMGYGREDVIEGGEGNDHLSGNRLNIAADGSVSVFGSSDNAVDTFIFNLGDDHDTLYEYNTSAQYQSLLRFGPGIIEDAITVTRSGDDVILEINTEDKVTIHNWFAGSAGYYQIGKIQFDGQPAVSAYMFVNSKLNP